jgi:hypothetical protein
MFFFYLKPPRCFFITIFFVQTCAPDHSHRALLSRPLTLLAHLHFLLTVPRPRPHCSDPARSPTTLQPHSFLTVPRPQPLSVVVEWIGTCAAPALSPTALQPIDLVVTSALMSADVSLESGSRSPDETDGAAGSVTHSIFVRFTSNFVREGKCHVKRG